nr:caspase family protein [Ectothiorhodospira lacustris]
MVIGINHYPWYGDGSRSLQGAIQDAEDVAEWLLDQQTGGGLAAHHLKLVTSRLDPLAPAKQDIDDALQILVKQARDEGARRFYFYFSGHGHVSGEVRHDVALCLPSWSRDRRHAALSSCRYLDYLLKCTPFTEIVVMLDCCRVRQVAAIGNASDLDCPLPAGLPRSVFVAYASEFLKAAFEGGSTARGDESGAEEDDEVMEVRGYFTRALLSGLLAGAARPEGGVTARGLKQYLEVHVERMSDFRQRPQIPLDMSEDVADSMLFGSALPESNVEIHFAADRHGMIELIGPTAEVLKRDDVSTGPWQVRLEQGLHVLREVDTEQEQLLRFMPTSGVTHVQF